MNVSAERRLSVARGFLEVANSWSDSKRAMKADAIFVNLYIILNNATEEELASQERANEMHQKELVVGS